MQNDFNALLKLDPNNPEAKKELHNVAVAIRQFKQKEKKVFGNIFAKGGLYDDVKSEEKKIEPDVNKVASDSEDEDVKEVAEHAEGEGEKKVE